MESLYSNEIRRYLRGQDWPRGVIPDVVEFEDCLKIRLYRDNLNKLDAHAKLKLVEILNTVLSKIRADGIPIYTWVAEGDGLIYDSGE